MGFKVELKMTGDWQRMASAVDAGRFEKNLEANLGKATTFNGMMVAAEIKRRIKSRKYAKNSPLTTLIKRSSTPLIDDGDLWGAITYKNINAYTVFVGVLRSTVSSDGKPMTNLVELLHEGGVIPVTDHMRNMFILLSEVGEGKRDRSTLDGRTAELAKALGRRISQIKPLKPETTHIVIPPRPFLYDVLKDPKIHRKCQNNWQKAAKAAFHDQASGSSRKGGQSSPETQTAGDPAKASKKSKTPADRSEAARRGWRTRRARQSAAAGKTGP